MKRPIAPGLSPNVEKQDALLAFSLLVKPWRYTQGSATKKLEQWFTNYYSSHAIAFSSGRGSLFASLLCLGVSKGDEVMVPGFTCVAVVDAILATGAKPLYIDIQNTFQMSLTDIQKKITKNTKAIIIQHTFGMPGGDNKIIKFARQRKVFIIEDCAHEIGISAFSRMGIASLFSFGRDKAFSSVTGGMVITKDAILAQKLKEFKKNQKNQSRFSVFQSLFHIISFYFLILPTYNMFSLGKVLLVFLQKISLLAKPIDTSELNHFSQYSNKFSPALAEIVLLQLKRLKQFNIHRQKVSEYYYKKLSKKFDLQDYLAFPLLRFPLLVENQTQLLHAARKQHMYLGDWYSNIIDPKGTNLSSIFYTRGMCPKAEYIASHIVNLPTYPTLQWNQVEKIVTLIHTYAQNTANNK